MIFGAINSLLGYLTRPYISTQQYFVQTFQSYLPTEFDEKSWYIIFGFMTFGVFIIAYILSRFITLKDADEDPVYQRTKLYAMQRRHKKLN